MFNHNSTFGGIAIHTLLTKHIRKALYGILLAGMVFSTSGAGRLPADRAASTVSSTDPASQSTPAELLRDFGLITSMDGWILMDSRLYWTTDSGADWKLITPALPDAATIYSVSFLDTQTGWLLWSEIHANGNLVLQLERTSDQGLHWTNSIIQALTPDDPAVDVENASMDWLDENTGWVSVKQKTGSNFSSGILFRTEDGGQTWQRLALPLGEPVHFVDSQVGWLAGGPAGDQLFKTQDGGVTWEEQLLPAGIAGGQEYSLYPPVFDSPENGLLALVTLNGDDSLLDLYSTMDAGQAWTPLSNLPLGSQLSLLPLSLLDTQNLSAALPNSDRILRMVNGRIQTLTNQDGMSAAIVDLKMLTSGFGWAKWNDAGCSKQAVLDGSISISCNSTIKLIETRDGGMTWQTLGLPGNVSGVLKQQYQASSTGLAQVESASAGKTLSLVGQGFDICTIPTLDQLQAWWNNSPYTSVNLYIGGAARACANPALTAEYVSQMRAQGWTFIPTWVGPQAPCTTFLKRFSYDVDNAYVEGRDEAYSASARLAELGLTLTSEPGSGGSVVYYDMEIYGGDTACRNAVNAFVNGWVEHMHDLGNLAGVYGSTLCTSGLVDYLTIPNIPDVIWPARWYLPAGVGTYDPAASVWNIGTCIPTTAWSNHQRIRQYAGDHTETWGGVALKSIDSDVLDGIVAVPYLGTPLVNFIASPLSGSSPLTVTFIMKNAAFMSACAWNYGDGQTGSSCSDLHTHTYDYPGTYTVSLTVSSPWGPGSLTRSNYINVILGTLDHFAISAIASSQTAGIPITGITLTAQDLNNATVTSFTGTVTYGGTAGVTGTSSAFTAGQLTGVSVTPTVAGNDMTFIVTMAGKTGTRSFNVNPGAASRLVFTTSAVTTTAGVASSSITVQRQDQYGNPNTADASRVVNLASDSNGTVTFTPSSSLTILTGTSSASFTYKDTKAGTPVITATSSVPTMSVAQQETIYPGALDHFAISPIASPQMVRTAITGITLTAQDHYNNTVMSYNSPVTYGGTAGVTGTSSAFTAGRLTDVSVMPTVWGSGLTFIVTGSGKTGTHFFDVNPFYIYLPLVIH